MISVYTVRGSALHCIFCEAFLAHAGFVLIEMDRLYVVSSMAPAADGERTLWRLCEARHAGAA